MTVRPNYKKVLVAVAAILGIVMLIALFSYCRFGTNSRLAFGIMDNCEATVLKLVKTPQDMELLRVQIFPDGLQALPVAYTNPLRAGTRYKILVERELGKFIYPAIKFSFRVPDAMGAPGNEQVTCQYGGVQYKDGRVLSMRLMYVDVGPVSIKNPFLYKEDGFHGWIKQDLEEWVELDEMTPSIHWIHFLDWRAKVLEIEEGRSHFCSGESG